MLGLRLLVMVLSIICLMEDHAEVSSSSTGMRSGGESPATVKQNKTEVKILDRKKKKSKKPKKPKKKKGKKPKPKPVTTTPHMTTSTMKTTTISKITSMKTTATTTTTAIPTTERTTTVTTTSTPKIATSTESITTETTSTTTPTTTSTTTATTPSPSTTAATTADTKGDCEATNGSPCIFPFKDGSTEYNECKSERARYYWCATSVYDSGKYKHWSYCPLDGSCPLPGGSCKTIDSKPCIFPFNHDGKEYNECADKEGKYFWCATSTTSSGSQNNWGKCPEDGTCSLKGQTTTSMMTPTTAAAATTPGTPEATHEMKKKVLGTIENLVVGESRGDSLQMAEMLHEELDTIIKDLKGETSKSGLSNFENIPSTSEILNLTMKKDQGLHVRDGSELGKGLMFDLSTVDSMKSVRRVSDDCCKDCKNKHSYTELAEYWKKLDACFCYQKKMNEDRTEVVPKTWTSSEFSTKTCEPSGCGYNSDVDPDRLLAEQNSAYLLNVMANSKYTDVFEVLNWNQGFTNPNINQKLFQDLVNKKGISSGYYMMFLAPASVSCDNSIFHETQRKLIPMHINQFSSIMRAKEFLDILVNSMDGKVPEWMNIVYQEMSPHVCMALQTTYFFIAMNRVQTLTAIFNFAFESERNLDKLHPFKECSTVPMTIAAMKNIADIHGGGVMLERSAIELYEWEALLPVVLIKGPAKNDNMTIVFIETKTETADENDFIGYSGPVVFQKGQTTTVTLLHIIKDKQDELNESFNLILKADGNNANNNVKIVIKESQLTRMQTRSGDLPKSLEELMTGSIKIVGTTWGAKGPIFNPLTSLNDFYRTGIDANNGPDLKNIWFTNNIINAGEFEGLVIEKQFDKIDMTMGTTLGTWIPGQHGVVVFKSQSAQSMSMNIFNALTTLGQTTLAGGITSLFLKREESILKSKIKKVKNVIYLPWLTGTIAMRKLDSGHDVGFTAQVNGCGIKLFTIKGSKNYDGTYMSHDNNKGIFQSLTPTGIAVPVVCPIDDTFADRLLSVDIVQNKNQISFIASVAARDAIFTPTGGQSYYKSNFEAKITVSPTVPYYIGKSTVLAMRKRKIISSLNPEWCLVLQRNIGVYDVTNIGLSTTVEDKIFDNNNDVIDLDPAADVGEFLKAEEEILVMRPIAAGKFGYEMICNKQTGTFHEVVVTQKQNDYIGMTARIVKCNGVNKVFIIDNAKYDKLPKLLTLFDHFESTTGTP